MTFDQIPAGTAVFLDANSLVYHFTNDPRYGVASTRLVQQIEQGLCPASPPRTSWRMSLIA